MRRHTKVGLNIVVLGIVGILVYRFAQPWIDATLQKQITDAVNTRGELRVAVDGWVGYFPLCSPVMVQSMRENGYLWRCEDDNADYAGRFAKLKKGTYDFAAATVDSYLLNARELDYPAPIVAVIDESKGGDALVAWQNRLPNIDAIKQVESLKIAYTVNSPSHHLLKAVASHFDVPSVVSKAVAVPSNGSEDALARFLNHQVDAAVLWEPDVNKALSQDGVVKLLSTADTQGLIVDVLLAGQDVLRSQPEVVALVLRNYFKTLLYYRNHQVQWLQDLSAHYRVNEADAQTLLKGVEWSSLSDNARRWYGLDPSNPNSRRLVEAIESAIEILLDAGDFKQNPLVQKDPYRLINSQVLAQLWQNAAFSDLPSMRLNEDGELQFNSLSESQWQQLQPVATLKVRPIVFASGASELEASGIEQIERLMKDLQHYPHFRIEIRGHTGVKGDVQANIQLSERRAQSVLHYLKEHYTLAENRARAVGLGPNAPLKQQPGESDRAYNYRLPRVELVLLEEEL